MNFKLRTPNLKIVIVGIALLAIMLIALFAIGTKTIFNNRASSNTVLVTIAPNSATLPATVKVYVDPQGAQLVFARVVINFDKTKLKLSSNPTISSGFQNKIKLNTMAESNPSGKIELVAGIDPANSPITTATEFATLVFDKNTTSVVTSTDNVSFSVTDSQIVALPQTVLTISAAGAKLQTPPPADTTVPATTITSPVPGNTVHGLVSVVATATDNVGVSKVELYVDSAKLDTDSTLPYSFNWETTGISNGSHSLTTKAYDAAGNVKASAAVAVTVSNTTVADTTAPTTAITAPASGSVNGNVNVSASATDNVGVTKVEFYVDSTLKSTDQTAPYGFSWDTTGVANGTHGLSTKAFDAAGNVKASVTVTVTVANSSIPVPPPPPPPPPPGARTFSCGSKGATGCYDCDNDGSIGIVDFGCFVRSYNSTVGSTETCSGAAQNSCSNCNSDSVVNILDFGCFSRSYRKSL